MKLFARITGILFILIGVLVLLFGILLVARGMTAQAPAVSLFGGAELASLLLGLRLFAGGLLSLQGLMLAALGEGLWLAASLVEQAEKSNRLMEETLKSGKR